MPSSRQPPATNASGDSPRKNLYEIPRLWLDAVHPGDRTRVQQTSAGKLATGEYDEEYRIVPPRRKDPLDSWYVRLSDSVDAQGKSLSHCRCRRGHHPPQKQIAICACKAPLRPPPMPS